MKWILNYLGTNLVSDMGEKLDQHVLFLNWLFFVHTVLWPISGCGRNSVQFPLPTPLASAFW